MEAEGVVGSSPPPPPPPPVTLVRVAEAESVCEGSAVKRGTSFSEYVPAAPTVNAPELRETETVFPLVTAVGNFKVICSNGLPTFLAKTPATS